MHSNDPIGRERPAGGTGGVGAPRDTRILGRLGGMEARLAVDQNEIRMAQALRFEVFCNEMSAQIGQRDRRRGLDRDRWDRICDHLLVLDTTGNFPRAVATYRLLTEERANAAGMTFYSQSEFDIAALTVRFPYLRFLELGRSCVRAGWRSKRTIELLWHGSWAYVRRYNIDVMFGCASFSGIDPQAHAEALSFLRRHAAPAPEWAVTAQPGRTAVYREIPAADMDERRALASLPPLIKGYLRLGAWIGTEPVVDYRFNTTDVLIILPVARLNPRYVSYYGVDAQRHAPCDTDQPAL